MADMKIVLMMIDKTTGGMQTVRKSMTQLEADSVRAAMGVDQVGGATNGLMANLRNLGGAAVGAFAAFKGLEWIKDIFSGGSEAASRMNETINKSAVVFGSNAGMVERFGDAAAGSIGQSKQSAIEAAATYGNLFQATGMLKDESADLSVNLVKLASDLASFNDTKPEDALEALRSGMVGMVAPLRRYGVNLIETNVTAKAMQMGLGGVGGALSDNDKILARYALILDQTKNAQGDFARTAGGAANMARTYAAEAANLQAELGSRLLPAQVELTRAGIVLMRGLKDTGDVFANLNKIVDDHTTEVSILSGVVGAAGAAYALAAFPAAGYALAMRGVAVATGLAAAAQWALNAAMVAGPWGLAAIGIAGVGTAFAVAYRNSTDFRTGLDAAMGATARFNSSVGQIHPELKQFDDEMIALSAHSDTLANRLAVNLQVLKDFAREAGIAQKAEGFLAESKANAAAEQERMNAGLDLILLQTDAGKRLFDQEKEQAAAADAAASKAEAAASKAKSDAASAASAAETAANKIKAAIEQGIRNTAQAATEAVSALKAAMDNLTRTPISGEGALQDRQAAIRAQIAAANLEMANLPAKGGRPERRVLAKRIADLQKEDTKLGYQSGAFEYGHYQIGKTLNPPLAEMTVPDILGAAQNISGPLAAATTVQTTYDQSNHVTISIDRSGNVSMAGTDTDEGVGRTIVNKVLEILANSGATTQPGASPALAGAR